MAELWERTTDIKVPTSTKQQREDLANDYKQKAMDMAKPGIEDENKFNELAKKHAPAPKPDKSDPQLSKAQEDALKKLEEQKQARAKFLSQFKNDLNPERERD